MLDTGRIRSNYSRYFRSRAFLLGEHGDYVAPRMECRWRVLGGKFRCILFMSKTRSKRKIDEITIIRNASETLDKYER